MFYPENTRNSNRIDPNPKEEITENPWTRVQYWVHRPVQRFPVVRSLNFGYPNEPIFLSPKVFPVSTEMSLVEVKKCQIGLYRFPIFLDVFWMEALQSSMSRFRYVRKHFWKIWFITYGRFFEKDDFEKIFMVFYWWKPLLSRSVFSII